MRKLLMAGGSIAALAAWMAVAQSPAGPVIQSAMKALGSENLKTLQFTGSGAEFCLGQQYSATSGYPKFNLADYMRAIDLTTLASRQTARRTQGEPIQGGCGVPVQPSNQNTFIAPNAQWAQKLEVLLTPQGFLTYAATHNATVAVKKVGKLDYDVITFKEGKYTMNGYVDAKTNLIDRVETWLDNPAVGDMLVEARFMDYKDFSGVKFPGHLVQNRGGFPVLDINVTGAQANPQVDLQPPAAKGGKGGAPKGGGEAKAGAPKGGGPPAPAPTETQNLGNGVYLMTGGYQTVLVEFKNYVIIWEAPTEARAAEAIAKAKELFPKKPIKYVVLSHIHSDHASGVGTMVAEGITLFTYKGNKDFFAKTLANPRTLLEGDKMAASGKKPKFELIGEKKVLSDSTQTAEFYLVKGNIHDPGNIIMYLPKLKVLVESDVYNYTAPNDFVHPWHANLYENLERLKLPIERIIPTHAPPGGRIVTMADLKLSVHK